MSPFGCRRTFLRSTTRKQTHRCTRTRRASSQPRRSARRPACGAAADDVHRQSRLPRRRLADACSPSQRLVVDHLCHRVPRLAPPSGPAAPLDTAVLSRRRSRLGGRTSSVRACGRTRTARTAMRCRRALGRDEPIRAFEINALLNAERLRRGRGLDRGSDRRALDRHLGRSAGRHRSSARWRSAPGSRRLHVGFSFDGWQQPRPRATGVTVEVITPPTLVGRDCTMASSLSCTPAPPPDRRRLPRHMTLDRRCPAMSCDSSQQLVGLYAERSGVTSSRCERLATALPVHQ